MSIASLGTVERRADRVARKIFRVENHDEALRIWRDAGCAKRVLVHVDAHHDMWWVPPGQPVTIANFISPALRDGLLREIYWVVPDRSWESAENRRQVLHHVVRILEGFPVPRPSIDARRDRISTTLLGKPLHICSVEGLPDFREEILLDLDVDYLIFPRVTYGPGDPHPPLPWAWPEDLLRRLDARHVRSDLVTIAYSVFGGFTPLRWKYFGDELEARLAGDSLAMRAFQAIREGAEAAARADFSRAEQDYLQAAASLPGLAAPLWHLACLYSDSGCVEEARRTYQRAVELDPSYRAPFNSDGLWHFWDGRHKAAEREFKRMLELDPCDAFAHLGMGWLAEERSDWSVAEREFRRALEIQPNLLDANRSLGHVLREQGRRREAVAAYEKSLKLALAGQESLRESPGIAAERPRLNDLRHFQAYLRLGELYARLGERNRAESYLRMAAAGGLDGLAVRCLLAVIAIRDGRFRVAAADAAQGLKQVSLTTGHYLRKFWRGVARPFRHGYELWQVR